MSASRGRLRLGRYLIEYRAQSAATLPARSQTRTHAVPAGHPLRIARPVDKRQKEEVLILRNGARAV
jgi:hypothetical protein